MKYIPKNGSVASLGFISKRQHYVFNIIGLIIDHGKNGLLRLHKELLGTLTLELLWDKESFSLFRIWTKPIIVSYNNNSILIRGKLRVLSY